MSEELKISPFNTIKGIIYEEENIDTFFNKIEKGIDKCSKYYQHDKLGMILCYDTNVYKIKDNYYKVSILNKDKTEYKDYFINTSEHPKFNVQFDKYVDVTALHEYEIQCYRKIENNEECSLNENKAYYNYLTRAIKCCGLYSLKKLLSMLRGPMFTILTALAAEHGSSIGVSIFTFLSISSYVQAADKILETEKFTEDGESYTSLNSIFIAMKQRRMLKKRMKSIQKVINDNKNLLKEEIVINSEDKYKNALIDYMDSIMKAANRLNDEDRKIILFELKTILDEYTNKCKELNNSEGLELSFEDSKRQIIQETINKLTPLQLKVTDIIKKDNRNKELYSENEKLMNEIDNSINDIEKVKTLGLSRQR